MCNMKFTCKQNPSKASYDTCVVKNYVNFKRFTNTKNKFGPLIFLSNTKNDLNFTVEMHDLV